MVHAIDLGETTYWPSEDGEVINRENGILALAVTSADISATKTATLQFKVRSTGWFNAQNNGEDITIDIAQNTTVGIVVQGSKKIRYRLSIAAGATGLVSGEAEN